MCSLKVDLIDIGLLIPYENNTKIHSEEEINQLAKLIDEFGFDVPIVVDENYVIIKGHKRRLALLKLGREKAYVIVRNDLTEQQVRAARIADNKVSESEWDFEMLKLEFQSLDDFELELTGFSLDEIDDILKSDISPIMDALENNVFVDAIQGNSDEFQVTFVFKKELKEDWEKAVVEHGKDYFTNLLIQSFTSEDENA